MYFGQNTIILRILCVAVVLFISSNTGALAATSIAGHSPISTFYLPLDCPEALATTVGARRTEHLLRLEPGGDAHVVVIEDFPVDGGRFTTRTIKRLYVPASSTAIIDRARQRPIDHEGFYNLIAAAVDYNIHKYGVRRNWPTSFHQKLRDAARTFLNDSTYSIVYKTDTRRIFGVLRVIRAPYAIDNDGQRITRGEMVEKLYGPHVTSFRPRGVADDPKGPIRPPETIPEAEYLDLDLPRNVMPSRHDENVGVGLDAEIGTFTVEDDKTLVSPENHDMIWSELWLQLVRVAREFEDPRFQYGAQTFHTYADPLSRKLYLPLGFVDLRLYGVHSEAGRIVRFLSDERPDPILKDEIKWWPIVFYPELLFKADYTTVPTRYANIALDQRRTELDAEGSDDRQSLAMPEALIQAYLFGTPSASKDAQRAILNLLGARIIDSEMTTYIGYRIFRNRRSLRLYDQSAIVARSTAISQAFEDTIDRLLDFYLKNDQAKERTLALGEAISMQRQPGPDYATIKFMHRILPSLVFDQNPTIRRRALKTFLDTYYLNNRFPFMVDALARGDMADMVDRIDVFFGMPRNHGIANLDENSFPLMLNLATRQMRRRLFQPPPDYDPVPRGLENAALQAVETYKSNPNDPSAIDQALEFLEPFRANHQRDLAGLLILIWSTTEQNRIADIQAMLAHIRTIPRDKFSYTSRLIEENGRQLPF